MRIQYYTYIYICIIQCHVHYRYNINKAPLVKRNESQKKKWCKWTVLVLFVPPQVMLLQSLKDTFKVERSRLVDNEEIERARAKYSRPGSGRKRKAAPDQDAPAILEKQSRPLVCFHWWFLCFHGNDGLRMCSLYLKPVKDQAVIHIWLL